MVNYNHPQHLLQTFSDIDNHIINCIVEIQKGSLNKYEIQKDSGILKLDRVMYSNMPYPSDYGLIPQTYDEDDDLLDVMILNDGEPFHSGSLVEGRVIGILHFEDTGEVDDKVLVVPNDDYRYKGISNIGDLSFAQKEVIDFYWNNYKTIQLKVKGKEGKTEIKSWGNVEDAVKIIEKAMQLYKSKFSDNPNLG